MTINRHVKTAQALVPAAACIALGACAMLPARQHWAKVTPVEPVTALNSGPSSPRTKADVYYRDAVSAIYRRDYGTALDALQAARSNSPQDVRILNAFAVVYDKLGRFDLSARYYAEAQTADPQSPIVRSNLAYSASLQLRANGAPFLALAPPQPTSPVAPPAAHPVEVAAAGGQGEGRVVVIGPGVVRLELPASPPPRALAGLTGHPLMLVNASGRHDGGEPVRTQLISLGWSAPKVDQVAKTQDRSTITYPKADEVAAMALSKTLQIRVQMIVCADNCRNIQLTVGRDSLAGPAASNGHVSRRPS